MISFSVVPFSFCLQSCPASGSCLRSWLFASGGQSIGHPLLSPSHLAGNIKTSVSPGCQMGMTFDNPGKLDERDGLYKRDATMIRPVSQGRGDSVPEWTWESFLRAQCCPRGRRRGHFSGLLCSRETFQEWETRHNCLNLQQTTKPTV